jgi:nicotinamidase-related amidase
MTKRVKAVAMVFAAFVLMAIGGCEEGHRAAKSNDPALVLIDLQRSFLTPTGERPVAETQVDPLIKAVNGMIDAARKQVVPVIYIKDEFSRFQFIGNLARDDAALRYEPGSAFDPRIDYAAGVYFTKQCEDGFSNSYFESHLNTLEVGRVVIAGVYANRSVLETAKSAIQRGFGVTVLSDAVAAESDAARDSALRQLKEAGAEIQTSDQFIASLNASGQ